MRICFFAHVSKQNTVFILSHFLVVKQLFSLMNDRTLYRWNDSWNELFKQLTFFKNFTVFSHHELRLHLQIFNCASF